MDVGIQDPVILDPRGSIGTRCGQGMRENVGMQRGRSDRSHSGCANLEDLLLVAFRFFVVVVFSSGDHRCGSIGR